MIRPSDRHMHALAEVKIHRPDLVEFFTDWRQRELETLPLATQNVGVAQGRCQVLNELIRLIQDAPETVRKRTALNGDSPSSTAHT